MASLDAGGTGPSDAHLLAAIAQGDREAFAALFGRYALRIKVFMLRAGASDADADEIAQEVMVSIWRRAGSFDPMRAAASTWIFAIARNQRIDMLRRGRRPAPDPDDPLWQPDPEPDGLVAVSLAEREMQVRTCLDALGPDQREILKMAFYDGLSHAEIADRTRLPLGTVKSRIRLAFGHLRGALGDDFAEDMFDG